MPRIEFASALQRHVACPAVDAQAGTLGALFDAAFAQAPALRDYVLDEQRRVRKHVAVFVNGELLHDRGHLARALAPEDRVYVAQALSGG
jgi:sulfur carrier protein ThiS